MTTLPDAYKLVQSLYDSGDLSHDQASPILEALGDAYAVQCDYDNLRYLYSQAQELRYLMNESAGTRGVQKRQHAMQRADTQWILVRSILEQLALDEQHPGRAGGERPDITAVILPEVSL